MHQGRMIFSGPMQDMRRRLRRDDFSLELGGGEAEIQRLAGQANALGGVEAHVRAGNTLVAQVSAQRSQAAVLAELLKLVDAAGLSLLAIHSGLHETENAYLQLLQEDQSHGFQRFDLNVRQTDVALSGNLPPRPGDAAQ
jgi:ABC-2 type transport system ATP-binding protein